jgi:hypothetical protein
LQNSLVIHVICTRKTRYSIKSHQHLALEHYRDKATLHFVSHNALAWRRKFIASKTCRTSLLELLSHPKVIALSKFEALSVLKVIARSARNKRLLVAPLHFNVAYLCKCRGESDLHMHAAAESQISLLLLYNTAGKKLPTARCSEESNLAVGSQVKNSGRLLGPLKEQLCKKSHVGEVQYQIPMRMIYENSSSFQFFF